MKCVNCKKETPIVSMNYDDCPICNPKRYTIGDKQRVRNWLNK